MVAYVIPQYFNLKWNYKLTFGGKIQGGYTKSETAGET